MINHLAPRRAIFSLRAAPELTFIRRGPLDRKMRNTGLNWLFLAILAAGIAARFYVATLGHDFDFNTWLMIARLPSHGAGVYATTLYNFAPGWLCILRGLYLLSGHDPVVFRYAVAGFLAFADAGIFFILWRKFGRLAGGWFFLNPISTIVSGYQNNFDNLGILFALLAALLIRDDFEKPLTRQKIFGLALLGFSLVLKHVFFAFPFWLAVKQRGLVQKCLVIVIPIAIFLASFAPFWPASQGDIIINVFHYRSHTTEFFYRMFVPGLVQYMFGSLAIWLFLMVLFAFIYRQKSTLETALLYTCVLVATAPASINEYIAIPMAFVATHLNVFTILYTFVATLHELVDCNGLHLSSLSATNFIDLAIDTLCLALAWVTWRQKIMEAARFAINWFFLEAKNQLRPKR
jgi:hypothetical protein